MDLLTITAVLFSIFTCLTAYIVYGYISFWSKYNVYEFPYKLSIKTVLDFLRRNETPYHCWAVLNKHLKATGQRFGGYFILWRPIVLTTDAGLIKEIMSSHFSPHFHGRGMFYNEKIDPLSINLLNIEGQLWKTFRTKLSPTFSPAKLKAMFDIVVELSKHIETYVEERSLAGEDFEIKELLTKYSCDAFGSCAFGIECNSIKNPESEFNSKLKRIFTRTAKDQFKILFAMRFTKMAEWLGIKTCDPSCTEFFQKVVRDVMAYRKETGTRRNDFMQVLIDEMAPEKDKPFTFNESASQAFALFLGALETTSTAMMFILYEMCTRPEMQEKVRAEIKEVIAANKGLTYEACLQMKYMKQVVDETLRCYPPVPLVPRKCFEDFKVPGTNSIIPQGATVIFNIYSLHRDPEYFPNPDVFDPERFSEENRANIAPYTYMPFGEGPRICIGKRFSEMQIPLALARLLINYRFTLSSKTILPLVFNKVATVSTDIVGGIFVNAEKIN